MAAVERKSDFNFMGELSGVYCEDLKQNWPRHMYAIIHGKNILTVLLILWLEEAK